MIKYFITCALLFSTTLVFSQNQDNTSIFKLLNIKEGGCPLKKTHNKEQETAVSDQASEVYTALGGEEIVLPRPENPDIATFEQNFLQQGIVEKPSRLIDQLRFSNGHYIFKEGNLFGFKNTKGETIIQPELEQIKKDKNYGFSGYKNGVCNYYDINGIKLPTKTYYSIERLENGNFLVQSKKGYGVVDSLGKVIITPAFTKVKPFVSYGKTYFRLYTNYNNSYILNETGKDTLWINLTYDDEPADFTQDIWIESGKLYNLKTKKLFSCNNNINIEPLSGKHKTIRVQNNRNFYLSDIEGKLISKLTFLGIGYIKESDVYIAVISSIPGSNNREDIRGGILSNDGKWLTEPQYINIRPIGDSLFMAQLPNGQTGVINKHNKVIIPFNFTKIKDSDQKNIVICTNSNESNSLISLTDGHIIKENVPLEGFTPIPPCDNASYIGFQNGKEYLADKNQNRITKDYDRIFYSSQKNILEGFNSLTSPEGYTDGSISRYFDCTGKIISFSVNGQTYDSLIAAHFLSRDLKHVLINKQEGYFIYQDKQLISAPFHWQSIEDANLNNYNTVMAFDGSRHGLINKKGEFIIPPVFEYISPFDTISGMATYIYDEKRKGYITNKGTFLFGLKYQETVLLDFDLYAVKVANKWGVVTETNKVVLPTLFDEIELKGGIVKAKRNSKIELYNLNGIKIP